MFDLPDPVSMFESAKNAGLERKAALDFVGNTYSSFLNLLWGLRKIPLLGPGFREQALGTLASIKNNKLFQDGQLRITVRKEMWNPDLLAQYQGEWLDPKIGKGKA